MDHIEIYLRSLIIAENTLHETLFDSMQTSLVVSWTSKEKCRLIYMNKMLDILA